MGAKRKLKIRKKAKNDLDSIWFFTKENWSTSQADKYLKEIIVEIEKLCSNPHSGKNISIVENNYWSKRAGSHLIIYRYDENNLHVLSVLHKSMDIKSRLKIN